MAETTNFTSLHADEGYEGDVTGNLTGDTFGTHTGDVKTSSIQDLDGTQQIGVSASGVSVASDLTIQGNLIVQGGETLLNTQTLEVEDFNIVIGNGNETSSVINGQGITLHGGSGTDITFQYGSNGYMYLSNKLQVSDEVKTTSVIADSAQITSLQATLTGNVTGNVTGQVSDISNHSTTDLTEGNNLYWTPARSDARIALQTGANLDLSQKSTTELAEGTNLYYTEARVDANIASKSTDDLAEGSNLYFTDARVQANRLDEMSVPTSNLDINSVRVTNVATPVEDADATTKLWVEQRIAEKDALSELSGTTDDLTEGTTNLFLTPNAQTINGNKTFTGATNISGTIVVPTPLSGTQAANKDYVDNAIASIDELSELLGTTDNITEGNTNLFFTNARVHSTISGGTGVSYDGSGQFSIGQPVGTADDVQFQKVFVREGTGVGVDLQSQTNNASLRFHTSNGQTGIISTTNGNAPVQVYSSLLWARAINGGTGNFTADGNVSVGGNLSVTGTISSPTITALEASVAGDVTALQSELDATQVGAGLNADGSYTANAGANFISGSSSLQDADNDLDTALKAEEAARLLGDATTLSSANSYTDTSIANLVDSAPATLDTLNEIATALGNDPNLSTTLTNQIAGVQSNLDAEIATTDAEITALQAQDVTLQSNIDSEAATRASADTTLQSNIDSEASARAAADTTLQSNIDAEATARSTADTTLQSNIDTVAADLAAEISTTDAEVTALQAADVTLQSNIDSEESARQSADTTLQSNIDSEAATRSSADTTLQSNIDTEEAARIAGDAATLAAAKAYSDSLDHDTAQLEADVAQLQTDLATETSNRTSADTTLQTNIDTVASDLASEITTTDAEISALQATDSAEASARAAADTTLQSNIDTVQSNLDAEISDRDLYFINENNTTKVLNPLRSSSITIGNNIGVTPAAGFATQFNRNVEFDNNTVLSKGGVALTPTFTELNYVNGVTSNIQTQLDGLSADITSEETARIAGDASTLSSAQSYTDTAVANLVDSAPAALDTLNELAAALGDDPNFATTITTSIGTKLATADFDSTFDTRLATKTTDNVTEGSTNVYFTNARARGSISAGGDLSYNSTTGVVSFTERTDAEVNSLADARIALNTGANLDLSSKTTTELAEGSNLYYTDARVGSYLTANGYATESYVDTADVILQSNIDTVATNLANEISTTNSEISALQSSDTTLQSNIDAEEAARIAGDANTLSSAQSYTDTALANLVDSAPAALDTLNELSAALGDDANFATTVTNQIAAVQADVDQNEADADAAIALKLNTADFGTNFDSNLAGKTTADLTEGANLYFTDARSRSAISVSGDLAYNSTTGVISFTERTDAEVNSLADARIALNTGANLDLSGKSTSDLSEGTNLYYTNARADARVNLQTGANLDLSSKTTDNLGEGASNQYYKDSRARGAISAGGDLSYNSTTGVMSFTERTDAQVNGLADARIAAASIDDLSDVTVSALATDGDLLRYNKSTGGWENVEITGTTNIEVEHTAGTITVKHGTSHINKTYDNADNGTATNAIPLNRAEVILDIAGTATNDVYLNIAAGTEGQEIVLVIDSAFTSFYNIYLADSGAASNATNMYGTLSLGSYNRTAVLRYCDSLGLWVYVGGEAYVSH